VNYFFLLKKKHRSILIVLINYDDLEKVKYVGGKLDQTVTVGSSKTRITGTKK